MTEPVSRDNRLATPRAAPHRGAAAPAEPVTLPNERTTPRAPVHQAFITPAGHPVHGPALMTTAPARCLPGPSRCPGAASGPIRRGPGPFPDWARLSQIQSLCARQPSLARRCSANRNRRYAQNNHRRAGRSGDAGLLARWSSGSGSRGTWGTPCRIGWASQGLPRTPQKPHNSATRRPIPTGIPRTKRHTPVHLLCVLKARRTAGEQRRCA